MATNNAVNVGLSGATGTGSFVGSTSPTLVTPTLGAAAATTLIFSPSTNGIIGTTTNDSASAGYVGQFISSVIAFASAVSLTNDTNKDVTSISLTAGDWDVWGNVYIVSAGNMDNTKVWSSSTSATLPDQSLFNTIQNNTAFFTSAAQSIPYHRYSLSGTTTIYLSCWADFTSTATACGGIYARRAR